MCRTALYNLLCFSFIWFGCSSSTFNRKDLPSYKKGSIQIECPNDVSYYLIEFSNDGEARVAFCFNRGDSLELAAGKADSLTQTVTFHLSEQDMQTLDSLVATMPTTNDGRSRLHDSFRYLVKIDGKSKIESNSDKEHINRLLKLFVAYFPDDEQIYDFCAYFSVFKAINKK